MLAELPQSFQRHNPIGDHTKKLGPVDGVRLDGDLDAVHRRQSVFIKVPLRAKCYCTARGGGARYESSRTVLESIKAEGL